MIDRSDAAVRERCERIFRIIQRLSENRPDGWVTIATADGASLLGETDSAWTRAALRLEEQGRIEIQRTTDDGARLSTYRYRIAMHPAPVLALHSIPAPPEPSDDAAFWTSQAITVEPMARTTADVIADLEQLKKARVVLLEELAEITARDAGV